MKALVVGRGWIGRKMAGRLGVEPVSHQEGLSAARYGRFDVVVNCAAVTGDPNVDQLETKRQETIQGNVVYPIRLLESCRFSGAKLAHFSSGCIFSGDRVFDENDEPNFDRSVYSLTKLVSDEELRNEALVLRIRMPFDGSAHPRNLLTKLAQYAGSARLVDSVNSISAADEMCDAAVALIRAGAWGPYHLVNTGAISTREIADYMGLTARWIGWDEFHAAGHVARSVCTLSNEKLCRVYPVREVHDAVEMAAREFSSFRRAA